MIELYEFGRVMKPLFADQLTSNIEDFLATSTVVPFVETISALLKFSPLCSCLINKRRKTLRQIYWVT